MSAPLTLEEIKKKFKDNMMEVTNDPSIDPRLPWSNREIALLLSLIKNHADVVAELKEALDSVLKKSTQMNEMVHAKDKQVKELQTKLDAFNHYNVFQKYELSKQENARLNILLENLQTKIRENSSSGTNDKPKET